MTELRWLEPHNLEFPPAEQALPNPNGLLAVGGDLSIERLLIAYRQGIFPWYEEGQPLLWWSPDPRTVLAPGRIHASRSMRRFLRRSELRVSFRSEEHTSELQSRPHLVCRLLLEKKNRREHHHRNTSTTM